MPRAGEEAVVDQILQAPGGKAGNCAVAAARLLGKGRVAVLGALGDDTAAKDHLRAFNEEGVVSSGLKFCSELNSGQAFIAVDESGENVIYSYSGANASLTPEDVNDPERRMLLSQAAVVAIMNPPFETAARVADASSRLGKKVTFDPGVRSQMGLGALRPLLGNVNYLIANESEIRNITGLSNPVDAARKLTSEHLHLKIVQKLGGRGSIMFHESSSIFADALNLGRIGMSVVNTVGCGDSFLGAFVAALVEGLPDLDALRWGTCAAGLKAAKRETRGSPNRETMLKYLDYVNVRS